MKKSFTIGRQQIVLDTESSREEMFWRLLAKQAWEPGTFKTFDRFISEESVCFDLGSWIGITTIYMAKLSKKVYGIEANPVTFEMLKKNLLLNSEVKNCVLLNNAVYDRNESMAFYNDSDVETASGSTLIAGRKRAKNSWAVEALSFSRLLKNNDLTAVDFIKMDIEGAEVAVLSDMEKYIVAHHPVMHISLHPFSFADKARGLEVIIRVLGNYQYYYDEEGRQVDLKEHVRKMTGFFTEKIRKISSFSVTVTDKPW